MVEREKSADSGEFGSRPREGGGWIKCFMGSRAAQNKSAVATVAAKLTANQEKGFSSGLAFEPLILTLPKGKMQTAPQTKSMIRVRTSYPAPKSPIDQTVTSEIVEEKVSRLTRLKIVAITKTIKVGQNTHGFS